MLTQLPTKLLHNNVPKASRIWFSTHHLHYQEKLGMIESINNHFLLQLPPKLLLRSTSSDYVVKVITTHHPHYKDKLVGNLTWTFVCAANCPCFLYSLNNLSATFFLAYNGDTFTVKPGSIIKKREPLRTSLYLLFHRDQPLSLLLGFTLKNASSDIYTFGNSKCATMYK